MAIPLSWYRLTAYYSMRNSCFFHSYDPKEPRIYNLNKNQPVQSITKKGFTMDFLHRFWATTAQMSPYLLFGFAVTSFLAIILNPSFISRHLGKGRILPIIKAAFIGVPMPLCSCSVVPVTASLAKMGAGKGATTSFLTSTPQTGVDSILVTHALLGPVYALIRVIVAFVSGIISGVSVMTVSGNSFSNLKPVQKQDKRKSIGEALKYGFFEMPADIGKELLIGLLITALLGTFIEPGQFSASIGTGLTGMLIMLAVGTPLYVCSTASVPIAAGLIIAGFSPGAVLVFLIAGPATNVATILTMNKIIGRKETMTYLISLISTAILAGFLVDNLAINQSVKKAIEECQHGGLNILEHISAVILLFLLLKKYILPKPKKKNCCCECRN